jgi:formylmethanofuran dehydrogenase subunit E
LKQSQVLCVKCTNGDLHLILKDSGIRVGAMNVKNRDEAVTIKKIMKEEALKPLFLMREE